MSQAPVMSYWLSTKTVPEQPNRAWKSTHLCFMRPNAVNVVADERDQTCIELQGFPQTMGSSVEHHWLPSAWGEKRTKKTTPECSGFCLVIFFFSRPKTPPFFCWGCLFRKIWPAWKFWKTPFRPRALHATVAEGKQLIGSFVTLAFPRGWPSRHVMGTHHPTKATSKCSGGRFGYHGWSSKQPKRIWNEVCGCCTKTCVNLYTY